MKKFSLLLTLLVFFCICICGCNKEGNENKVIPTTESSGVSLTIIDDKGVPVSNVSINILKNTDIIETLVTDSNGKASISLISGEYSYSMESVPEGFILDDAKYPFDVVEGISKIELSIKKDETAGILLKTIDNDGNPIQNVTFDILKGEEVIATLNTGEEGEAMYYLASGEYSYVMKSVPDGFTLDNTAYSFNVRGVNLVKEIIYIE